MSVKIITDSSSDLPKELVQALDIEVIPLRVHFGEQEYRSGVDINSEEFYQMMRESKELPKTSSPSPQEFFEAFHSVEAGREIVAILISSQVSSTYDHAMIAKGMYLDQYPNAKIEVLDSKNASVGLGLIVYKAAKLAKEGKSYDEILETVKGLIEHTVTLFILETLENIIKGGRLDRLKGAIASVLNIKLLMRASKEGTIEVVEKVRGSQGAIKRLIEHIGECGKDFEQKVLAIAHSNCEEKARKVLKQILERYPFREVVFTEMGPVIGTHAGEGGILISY